MRNYTESPDLLEQEAQFTRKPHLKPRLYNDTLHDILKVAPQTLDTNRRGRLTQTQRDGIAGDLKTDGDGMYLLLNIFLAVSLLLALIFLSEGLPMIFLVGGAGIMLSWLLFYTWRRQGRLRGDLTERITRVEGVARLHTLGGVEGAKSYGLIIADQYFAISRDVYDQLVEYELPPMRAYISAKSKALLSLEILPDDVDKTKNNLEADETKTTDADVDPVTEALLADEAERKKSQRP
jgi:hypothetical protein